MDFSACPNDDAFGPSVQRCREDFDFTLKFEKIFLSIIPSVVFVALSAPRLAFLGRGEKIVKGSWFQLIKLATIFIYASFQLALLIIGILKSSTHNAFFISASVLGLAAALCAVAVSYMEHSRSPRPSILLNIFLFLSLLFDVAQTRSIWLSAQTYNAEIYAGLFTASTVWKAVLVLLESKHKQHWLGWDPKAHSPEETSGIYGLSTLFWLNPLLFLGYRQVLTVPDLLPLDQNIATESLHQASLSLNPSHFKRKKNALARTLGRTLVVPFLLPIAPRIVSIGFSICQPLLIKSLLSFLDKSTDAAANTGYGLIGATVIIYLGLPVSTALYEYFVQRALFKARACLVTIIYQKTTQGKASGGGSSNALTLMSTDIERIQIGLQDFNELWAIPVQGLISTYFLYHQLGTAFVTPLILIVVCVCALAVAMPQVGSRQKGWMNMIQRRVGTTANTIGNMKNIKMSGLARPIESAIQDLRVDELRVGNKFRTVLLIFATISYMPMLLSPLFTFAVTSRSLNSANMFASVAYLYILTEPLMLLFQQAPAVRASFTCLQRIQDFLEQESRQDYRRRLEDTKPPATKEADLKAAGASPITIVDGTFGWTEDMITLQNINATIVSGLTMVIGPVASGKSTLCKTLLGEIPFAQGEVIMGSGYSRIGFCDQTPFLQNASIRENIVGFSILDEVRYAKVIDATMLAQDLSLLPHGDHTNIGSSGIALSGGQKQRVSIARALYQQCDMCIFDDVLSGLDAETEKHVFDRVFGPEGLLRKSGTPTVLCTHAVHHLQWADHIIALSATGTVAEQGTFDQIAANQQYVHGLGAFISGRDSKSDVGISAAKTQGITPVSCEAAESTIEVGTLDASRALGDSAVFFYYFKRVGSLWTTTFLVLGIMCGFLYNFSAIWLQYWSTDATSTAPKRSTASYIGIYGMIQGLALAALTGVFGVGMLTFIKLSGSKLHETTIKTVTAAPLWFLTATDTGVITNLFAQDLTLIDNELPLGLINTNILGWMAVGAAAVAATASPYILIAYPFNIAIVYFIQKFYLRTSRQLRLLDLEAKSPLYTNFIDTINGLVTIRAFGWVEATIAKNDKLLNTSQRPAYLLRMLQRWITLVLGIVVAALAVLVVTLSTQLRTATGFTGASMVSLMTFGKYLASLIHSFTLLETSMGAVNRLKTFSETTPREDLPGEDIVPPVTWPEKGTIEIRDVSASFSRPGSSITSNSTAANTEERNCALKNIAMTIEAGQKVAICGRTGSGKSSTILLLLRMLEPLPSSSYTLSVDGLSLDTIDRATLRERLIVIPQEPVFLPDGTSFMTSLDPFGTALESECQAALEVVGLWDLVQSRGGLATGLVAESLSHGHKQLFSLAKAIVRRRVRSRLWVVGTNGPLTEPRSTTTSIAQSAISPEKQPIAGASGLLILDEFNSSLDLATDKMVQDIILDEFQGYTILTVSHRLESMMHFDRVVVISNGRIIEQGVPKDLVLRQGSHFRDLWMARNEEQG